MGSRRLVSVLILLTLAAAGGCSVLQEEPRVQAHELAPQIPEAAPGEPGHTSLHVSPMEALAGYATPQIAYRERAFELSYYSRNEWVAEPARLIETWLVATLEASGAFASVVSGVSAPAADLRLDTELIILRHEFDATPSRVRIVMRAQMMDALNRVVLGTRRFEEIETAPSSDAYGGVLAVNRALERLLPRISAFCVELADR